MFMLEKVGEDLVRVPRREGDLVTQMMNSGALGMLIDSNRPAAND